MVFKFQPLTEEQLKEQSKFQLLAEGPGNFQIIKATEKISKAGQPMIELVLKCWDKNGLEGQIYDYLTGQASWKIKQLLESIGHPNLYEAGQFDEFTILHGCGDLEIKIQKSQDYGDKNAVKSYLPPSEKKKEKQSKFDERVANIGKGVEPKDFDEKDLADIF